MAKTIFLANVVEGGRPDAQPLDSIAELHCPAAGALDAARFDSPAGDDVIRRDRARFIGWTTAYRVAEFVISRRS